jgi:hypothetical protein
MGKKRVPISLRKPPSPEAAPRDNGASAPEAEPPAPLPEVSARAAEPEVVALAAEPVIAACAPAPEVAAPVAEPAVMARAPEPPVAAPIAEPTQALQPVAKEAPPAIVVGADGRTMRAVTIYLPAELVDRIMLYCMEQGRDVLREAIEASLDKRLGQGAPAPAAATAEAARSASQRHSARRLAERVERWLDLGRTLVQSLRGYVRSTGAAVGAS